MLQTGLAQGRYAIGRTLGEGAMGIVYDAYDREREAHVALKVLRHVEAATIQAFKAEFRALADLRHENVVELFDLVVGEGTPYFTMELVNGSHFLDFLRRAPAQAPERTITRSASPVDLERLVGAASQLARGLMTVHAARLLHRDIKPSNVLVDERGRVVIVDFGIAVRLRGVGPDGGLSGTASYMAPELVLGEAATAASDWYAVGTVLFEALTGRLPFQGSSMAVLEARVEFAAPRARDLRSDVPPHLDALCAALLDRNPALRPTGSDVLERLSPGGRARGTIAAPVSIAPAALPLVGREAEREVLCHSLRLVCAGAAACAMVRGASGAGKTTLIRSFVEEECAAQGALVLEGRCYERESVPYKGLDAVVDALVSSLLAMPTEKMRALLPAHGFNVLCRLFPVMQRLEADDRASRPAIETEDVQQLRSIGFAALREMLEKVARVQPLVVVVDDIQWGDGDTALLLADIWFIRGVLLLLGHRTDAKPSSVQLTQLLERQMAPPAATQVITLAPLSARDAEQLVRTILAEKASVERVERVIEEAGRTPLFLSELAHFARSFDAPLEELRLTGLLANRLKRLPSGARGLLELAAVAGRPTALAILRNAAGVSGAEATELLSALSRSHLLRPVSVAQGEHAAPFHDRIREAVVAELDASRLTEIHQRLAAANEAAGSADPETLFEHHRGAGNRVRALEMALKAGERAESAFAADRAAQLYASARELLGPDDPLLGMVQESLGRALAASGHGGEAADAFLVAARGRTPQTQFDLQRRACEQLLISGHIDRGVRLAEKVLDKVHLRLARSWWQAVLSLVWLRLLKLLRGLTFRARAPSAEQREAIARLDVAYAMSTGLIFAETVRGTEFATRALLLAMRAGDPSRAVRALAVEGTMIANEGDMLAATGHFELGWQIAVRYTVPDDMSAILYIAEADVRTLSGRFRDARVAFQRAKDRYARLGAPNRWELTVLTIMSSINRAWLGEWPELDAELPVLLRDASDRGDRFLGTMLRVCEMNMLWLVRDEPGLAREAIQEGLANWTQTSFRTPHSWAAASLSLVELYEGNPLASLRTIEEIMDPMRRSFLMRFHYARIRMYAQRGICAVACALAVPGEAPAFIAMAHDAARRLEREDAPLGPALGCFVRGGIASVNGDRVDCLEHFQRAARLTDDLGMAVHAAVARRRVGEVDSDSPSVLAADTFLKGRGVRNVERLAFALAPVRLSQP